MDKKVMFAVAGAGKTTYLLNQLREGQRALVITYTNNNLASIRNKVVERWDCIPIGIKIDSYFSFLYNFCYKPFLAAKINAKGMNWKSNLNRFASGIDKYLDKNSLLYSNRLAKLLEEKLVIGDVIRRIEKYFDLFLVDEIQDFAGHDYNFLVAISCARVKTIHAGDYFQHTFDTSRDGGVNRTLHEEYTKYVSRFKKAGFTVDMDTLVRSYRCSPSTCRFIQNSLGIMIESRREDLTEVLLVEDSSEVLRLLRDNSIIKLFYQEHYRYDCYSRNWGGTKGEDNYFHVCVVLNKTTLSAFRNGTLCQLKPGTKNKFYVACSRSRGNLYFISQEQVNKMTSRGPLQPGNLLITNL